MNKHEPPLEPALRPMSRIGSIFGSTFRVAAHHLPIEIHAVLAQSLPCTILFDLKRKEREKRRVENRLKKTEMGPKRFFLSFFVFLFVFFLL